MSDVSPDGSRRSARADFAADLIAHGVVETQAWRIPWLLLSRPGLLAQFLLRLQQALYRRPAGRRGAQVVRGLNHMLTGADFAPGCEIGPGLRIEHPNGIVVGTRAVVGRNAFLCQRVTLGERLGDGRAAEYPVLGDGVFVGTGATVLGAVMIGYGARIGAAALVLSDVPPLTTAVGCPARIVRTGDASANGHEDAVVRQDA